MNNETNNTQTGMYTPNTNNVPTKEEIARRNEARRLKKAEIAKSLYPISYTSNLDGLIGHLKDLNNRRENNN